MDFQIRAKEEKLFLEAIALRLTLTGDTQAAFLKRFSRENATQENSTLVHSIAWNNPPVDPNQKIQDELKKICDILEKDGCRIIRPDGQKKRGRAPKGQSPWEQANKWLWESRFPEWRDNQRLVSGQEETGRNGQADIDALVQHMRSRLLPFITAPDSPIGTMKMLSVSTSVPVDKIYIDLNVLEQPSCTSHFSNWRQEFNPDKRQDFDRLGLSPVQKRVEALWAVKEYPKLMVLGKPGAGKTTFLKSLAVECIKPETELFADLVPLFVTLRDFATEARKTQSWNLLDYLTWLLVEQSNISDDRASAEKILTQGRSLVLLDGLDEVPPEDLESAIDAVRAFGCKSNRLIITCRTQSQQSLDGFTDVEVADFTPEQVDQFVDNWFKIVDAGSQESLAPQLKQQLRVPENKAIAELTITPVLLSLICVVFHGQGKLPKKRFELYTKGMRQLLERIAWRKLIDERLTIDTKEKFLADLALMLFEKNDYFPEEQTLENFIKNYFHVEGYVARKILTIFEIETGLLIKRSEGYWSFSHLTFHEYFTALKIIESSDLEMKKRLNSYIGDKRWHEVFRLISERKSYE
jgi:predicted NACHT family NTPase